MERFGFVGLPNAGKSSLYNALAGGGALAAPYAFATTDPNVGVAKVPDERLDELAAMSKSRNVVPATVQFVDIGGLVEGASKGEGLGNRFLGHIREVDAVVYVLRAFADDDVPGPSDPLEHLRVVETELASPTSRPSRTRSRSAARRRSTTGARRRGGGARAAKAVLATARRSTARPDAGDRRPARAVLPPHQQAGAGGGQRRRGRDRRHRGRVAPVRDELAGRAEVIGMCVQLEAEAAQLDGERAGRDARGARPRRGRAAAVRPHRLPPARAAHLPHHGREGDPGLDVPGRLEGAAVRRA